MKSTRFAAHEVVATLEGRKTQFRKAIPARTLFRQVSSRHPAFIPDLLRACPFGGPGSRVWVQETFGIDPFAGRRGHHRVLYRATQKLDPDYPVVWRASTNMSLWASRLTLEILSVRVCRLTETTEADALAEGVGTLLKGLYCNYLREGEAFESPRASFFSFWQKQHGRNSVVSDPWVWAITFRPEAAKAPLT